MKEATDVRQTTPFSKPSFISGHLGNYADCPEDGFRAEPKADGAEDSDGISAGDCADENCGSFNSCEGASAIVRLSNGGDLDALGVLVQKIELKNENGETLALLPLESVTLVENNQQFSGTVGVDETPSIRIDFQGPVNVYELLNSAGADSDDSRLGAPQQTGPILHITLSADNAEDVIVISPVVSSVPSVDT